MTTLSLVILCSWSVSHALFSSEFLLPAGAVRLADGGARCLDFELSRPRQGLRLQLESAYLSELLVRDTLSVSGVRLGSSNLLLSAGIDTVFIPGFTAYDDAGGQSPMFPFAAVLYAEIRQRIEKQWSFRGRVHGGTEIITDYDYNLNLIYAAEGSVHYEAANFIQFGVSGGFSDLREWNGGAGVLFRLGWIEPYGCFLLEGNKKSLLGGAVFVLGPVWSVVVSAKTTLDYGGFMLSTGVEVSSLKLWGVDTALSTAVAYSPGGVTAGLSMGWNFELASPEKSKPSGGRGSRNSGDR